MTASWPERADTPSCRCDEPAWRLLGVAFHELVTDTGGTMPLSAEAWTCRRCGHVSVATPRGGRLGRVLPWPTFGGELVGAG